MEEIVFHVSKEQEGQYLPIRFEVEDIERLDVYYSYTRYRDKAGVEGASVERGGAEVSSVVEGASGAEVAGVVEGGSPSLESASFEEVAIIDFSMIGPNDQYLGSSGSNRTHLYFSERESSVGFHVLDQMEGTWTILLGAYKVPEEGVQVTYHFQVKEKTKEWYKGDLHLHTQASDGQLTAETIVALAKQMDLDFIALTDHNNYHPEAGYLSDSDLTVIPGVEWTQYRGHGNFLNLSRALKGSFVTNSDEEVSEMLALAHEKEALFVVNHPFCPHVPWTWSLDVEMDAIEVINGATDPRANLKAIKWWHEQLLQGRRIPAIGGSDFHRFDQVHSLGSPTTHLLAKSKSQRDLLAAVMHGAAYITMDINGPSLDIISQSGYSLGDTVVGDEPVTLLLNHLKAGYLVKLITDTKVEEIVIEEDMAVWHKELPCRERGFIRFEIWDQRSLVKIEGIDGFLLLVSNPLYYGETFVE